MMKNMCGRRENWNGLIVCCLIVIDVLEHVSNQKNCLYVSFLYTIFIVRIYFYINA